MLLRHPDGPGPAARRHWSLNAAAFPGVTFLTTRAGRHLILNDESCRQACSSALNGSVRHGDAISSLSAGDDGTR
eukprot:10862984-Karenia_brevis.AAC.1